MRKILSIAALAATMALTAGPVLAATTCIDTRDIKNSQAVDKGKALLFTMKNGDVYRNNLKGACPDLVFDGFVWTVRNPNNTVCDNMETIRVLQSGQICEIGTFDKQPGKSKIP